MEHFEGLGGALMFINFDLALTTGLLHVFLRDDSGTDTAARFSCSFDVFSTGTDEVAF